jgi:hypothetical protein
VFSGRAPSSKSPGCSKSSWHLRTPSKLDGGHSDFERLHGASEAQAIDAGNGEGVTEIARFNLTAGVLREKEFPRRP